MKTTIRKGNLLMRKHDIHSAQHGTLVVSWPLLPLLLLLTLAFAACGGGSSSTGATATNTTGSAPSATNTPSQSGGGAATISMGVGQFSGNVSVTIKAGQSVTFDDTDGGPHNLVTGTGGAFSAEAGAPSQFTSQGIPFSGGDKTTVVFPTAGVYHITCTFHPSMQATVTVTA